jgi:6-pyruvoyltetrahydropterin/6-carboxytetrahydropterin synthase
MLLNLGMNKEINMYYTSSKKIGPISTGHRQWKHSGHCSFAHGYGRYVEFTFECSKRDHRGWVMDFGDLKDVKKWLEKEWDHRLLLAHDDPLLDNFKKLHKLGGVNINIMPEGYGPGIEDSCKYVFDHMNIIIKEKTNGRAWIKSVKIYEHENNWAEYGL